MLVAVVINRSRGLRLDYLCLLSELVKLESTDARKRRERAAKGLSAEDHPVSA